MFDWINIPRFELSENMIILALVVLIIVSLIIKKRRSMKLKNKNTVQQVDNLVLDDKEETESVSSSRRSSRVSQLPGYEESYGYPVQ
jgi:hypothetical protein